MSYALSASFQKETKIPPRPKLALLSPAMEDGFEYVNHAAKGQS